MLLSPSQIPANAHTFSHSLHIPPPSLCTEPTREATSPASTALQTTCRELQSLIASPHRSLRTPTHPTSTSSLQSPIELERDPLRRWRAAKTNKIQKPRAVPSILRTAHKVNKPTHISIPRLPTRCHGVSASEKENHAPMTPAPRSAAPPVLPLGLEKADFEVLEADNIALKEFRPAIVREEADGGGERRTELSRYDEAMVGLLLKQMRLRGWEGEGSGRRARKQF